jgi:hypothetical protein
MINNSLNEKNVRIKVIRIDNITKLNLFKITLDTFIFILRDYMPTGIDKYILTYILIYVYTHTYINVCIGVYIYY